LWAETRSERLKAVLQEAGTILYTAAAATRPPEPRRRRGRRRRKAAVG
jgi:hypothetical protein